MSFDIFLLRISDGEAAAVDKSAVRQVLRSVTDVAPDQYGYYRVAFSDGSRIDLWARGLEDDGEFTGCSFNLRGASVTIFSFIFDVAVAGDMMIFNAQTHDTPENPSAILSRESQRQQLPIKGMQHTTVCTSALHLSELLGFQVEEWAAYRESILTLKTHAVKQPA